MCYASSIQPAQHHRCPPRCPSLVWLERAATPSSDALKKKFNYRSKPELLPFGGFPFGGLGGTIHEATSAWREMMGRVGNGDFQNCVDGGRRHCSLASAQHGLLEGQEKGFLF